MFDSDTLINKKQLQNLIFGFLCSYKYDHNYFKIGRRFFKNKQIHEERVVKTSAVLTVNAIKYKSVNKSVYDTPLENLCYIKYYNKDEEEITCYFVNI